MHTQPEFPKPPGQRGSHSLGRSYNGQIFLCISLNSKTHRNAALAHINHLEPCIYSQNLYQTDDSSNQLCHENTNLEVDISELSIADFKRELAPGLINFYIDINGLGFHLTSKPKSALLGDGNDIYELFANALEEDIFVQSWQNGRGGRLSSACPAEGNKVENVKQLSHPRYSRSLNGLKDDVIWKTSKDHAKWLVLQKETSDMLCVGDMNRIGSQKKRYGGLVCFENRKVAKKLRQMIGNNYETCVQAAGR